MILIIINKYENYFFFIKVKNVCDNFAIGGELFEIILHTLMVHSFIVPYNCIEFNSH